MEGYRKQEDNLTVILSIMLLPITLLCRLVYEIGRRLVMESKFKRGDIIIWNTKATTTPVKQRVVDVWDSGEPVQLLVTDIMGISGKCHTALAADCEKVG